MLVEIKIGTCLVCEKKNVPTIRVRVTENSKELFAMCLNCHIKLLHILEDSYPDVCKGWFKTLN